MTPLLFALALTPAADPGPLRTTPTADLGEVRSGPPCVHTFELTNRGAGPITLRDVAAGCGCTKVELSAKELKAGDTAKLTVTTNTLTQPEGAVRWPLTVRFRDGGTDGTLELAVTAKLVKEISVTPPLLAISTSAAVTQTLTLTDRRAKPLSVVKAATTDANITATVKAAKTADGKTTQEIVVSVADALPAGDHSDTVTLTTDDGHCPTLEVPVRVLKRSADGVTVTPDAAAVRFADGQRTASAVVQVRAGGKQVAVKSAECAAAGVSVRHAGEPGPVVALRVVVDAAKAGASGAADVTVTLSEPAGTKLVVPVTWGR